MKENSQRPRSPLRLIKAFRANLRRVSNISILFIQAKNICTSSTTFQGDPIPFFHMMMSILDVAVAVLALLAGANTQNVPGQTKESLQTFFQSL